MESTKGFVRLATKKDIPVLLELLREHSLYERGSPDHITSTEESLQVLLEPDTSSSPSVPSSPRCLLISDDKDGITSGLAIYYHTYSSWRSRPGLFLEDLYVQASQRGKGYGKKLVRAVAEEGLKIGAERVQWTATRAHDDAVGFYEKLGGEKRDNLLLMRLDEPDMRKLVGAEQL